MLNRLKLTAIILVIKITDVLTKLIGAFRPDVAQVSKAGMVITYEESEEDGANLRIMVPFRMAVENSEHVEKLTTIIAWVLTSPEHYWRSSALGVDVVEEAYKKVGDVAKVPTHKNDD